MTVLIPEKKLIFTLKEKKSGLLEVALSDLILIENTIKSKQVIVNTIKLTFTSDITTKTLDSNGLSQDGRTVILDNGNSDLEITVDNPTNTNYLKTGFGSVTFKEGVGRNLLSLNGIFTLGGGIEGLQASIISDGTTDYLTINE